MLFLSFTLIPKSAKTKAKPRKVKEKTSQLMGSGREGKGRELTFLPASNPLCHLWLRQDEHNRQALTAAFVRHR
jgi:hypothetical protein